MGPYDNSKRRHIFDDEIINAHWFRNREGYLLILPREGDGFEEIGTLSPEVDKQLFSLDDEQLDTFTPDDLDGVERVPDVLRRFDKDAGYFVA